ncbi:hypothetical protein [Kitasatospora sp. NPDC088134]|uniref:hypothetical protein n=1 Tax=Kitasatospora sp. NPDC088134 TaxID=3364071 RepID=UPI00380CC262
MEQPATTPCAAGAQEGILTFGGGEVLVLTSWGVTEYAPDADGRVYAKLFGRVANPGGRATAADPTVLPIRSGPAQLTSAHLRGRPPLRHRAVHVRHRGTGEGTGPDFRCEVPWLERRVDEGGAPVPETEVGRTSWTDPATGQDFDLRIAYLEEEAAYNPLGFTWQHFGRWSGGVPLLHAVWGEDRTPADGLVGGVPLNSRRWTRAQCSSATEDCTCVEHCDEDPATVCNLSGRPHVHPADPPRPGVWGPCPEHPGRPGDR